MNFISGFRNNSVFILDGLRSDDLQTARHLYEDIVDSAPESARPYCRYAETKSCAALSAALDDIESLCRSAGIKPILQFEAHGDKEFGLLLGDDQEAVPWSDLVKRIADINVITENNTGVVLAACEGMYAVSPITIKRPTPFYFLIGSEAKVKAGYIDQQMRCFYQKLLATQELAVAMTCLEERFLQYHCERFLAVVYARYINRRLVGKGKRDYVELMVSTAFDAGAPRTPENLKKLRKAAKDFASSSDERFQAVAKFFLHGRVSFQYDDIVAFVRDR
jgi:hypothetical protein